MLVIVVFLLPLTVALPLTNSSVESTTEDGDSQCRDGVHNLIRARSDFTRPKPAMIKHFSGTVYGPDGLPSCHNKRPSVVLPGYVKLLKGELHVPKHYDLKSAVLKLTVKGANFDDALCLNGESQYIALPSSFCTVDLCKWIGNDKCELLQEPGVHTLAEMEEKLGFNRTLELPDPPSLLGISLLDLFSGDFWFAFTVESGKEQILDVHIPVNDKYLQIGVTNE